MDAIDQNKDSSSGLPVIDVKEGNFEFKLYLKYDNEMLRTQHILIVCFRTYEKWLEKEWHFGCLCSRGRCWKVLADACQ